MKTLLTLSSILLAYSIQAQVFVYDDAKNKSLPEIQKQLDNASELTATERKNTKKCLSAEDFTFEKNDYHACLKNNIEYEKLQNLLDASRRQIEAEKSVSGKKIDRTNTAQPKRRRRE